MARELDQRAGEFERHREQLQSARILVVLSIGRIAEHRQATLCEVAADLVLAAGDEFGVERTAVARSIV